jgi:hypothetical protein
MLSLKRGPSEVDNVEVEEVERVETVEAMEAMRRDCDQAYCFA